MQRFIASAVLVLAGLPAVAATAPYRTYDGRDNNLERPAYGSAGVELLRLTTPAYADGLSEPAGADRPSAREISNVCVAQEKAVPNRMGVTDFFWAWGQFVDHDISITGAAEPEESFDIAVPAGDPFFDPAATGSAVIPLTRSAHSGRPLRQQVNQISAWIDGSQVYGSDAGRAAALRRGGGRGDRLRTSAGRLLPNNDAGLDNAPVDGDPRFFLAGDVRANENVALTALHTLFVREHNRLVKQLRRAGVKPAEERYQRARALVVAQLQAITYNEFLPLLLGPRGLSEDGGYRPDVNPGISNVFSSACYRFGHSMLPHRLLRVRRNGRAIADGHLLLRDAFFAPEQLRSSGLEPLLRGLAARRAQEVDSQIVDDVRNFLFGPPGAGGFDLAALNIQRGRDHGLASYNQTRRDLGLAPAVTFADVTSDRRAQRDLERIYGSVENIDVWVGALAEDHMPGSMVGELGWHVLRDQFERLRDGDRFWYRRALSPEDVAWVEEQTLAQIIRRNTSIGKELPDNPFRTRGR